MPYYLTLKILEIVKNKTYNKEPEIKHAVAIGMRVGFFSFHWLELIFLTCVNQNIMYIAIKILIPIKANDTIISSLKHQQKFSFTIFRQKSLDKNTCKFFDHTTRR